MANTVVAIPIRKSDPLIRILLRSVRVVAS
jgi:hypothetical protein